jgi:hypothetical protein
MEKLHYIEETDQLVTETIYDAESVIEENAAIRASGPVEFGSKGQKLVLAMRLPVEHVTALRNMGYDLLSPDPAEARRAMLYVQANQAAFLTTDKKMIGERKQKWV